MGLATISSSLSILLVQPTPSTSHHVWTMNLLKGLLSKGHHVHIVSIHEPNIEGKLAENMTYGIFGDVMQQLLEAEDYDPNDWEKLNVFQTIYLFYNNIGLSICEKTVETKGAKELLEMIKNVEFDVIVHDLTLLQCLYGLWHVAKGKPPVVGYIPYGLAPWLKDCVGGTYYPTVRSHVSAAFAKPEGLWQKTWNTIYYITDDFVRSYYYMPLSQRIAERYVGHEIRSLHELEKNITILLINTHPAFEPAIPLPPNAIEIGGLHVEPLRTTDEKAVTYPDSIREFLDSAENGAVIISLGTNVNWKSIGVDKLKAVTQALSKLNQRVIWKLEIELSFQKPNNVMVVKWLQQNEILGHKNIKAIWTHGGLLSTQEAIWKGVPVIGMPFYMDQIPNVELLVLKGAGVRLDFATLSTESILDAFEKVLYNKSYTKNMKQLSNEFRDRPVPPLDLAVWWIEYAARHPSGNLGSPLRSQSWVEQNLIDIYAFLFLNLIIILSIVFFVLKKLFKFCNCICSVSKLQKRKQT
ncbi:UDP-glucuronosyltransferase 1-9-like isoform X1 [Camponotus japonicus]